MEPQPDFETEVEHLTHAGYSNVVRLGQGSFGDVYLGSKDSKRVALKRIHPHVQPSSIINELTLFDRASKSSSEVPAFLGAFRDKVLFNTNRTRFPWGDYTYYFK
jgi:serine/threonine protein kinase